MYNYNYSSDYDMLGVTIEATVSEIKYSFRQLAKVYHPDNQETGNEAKFKLLNAAYERVLNNKPETERAQKPAPKPTPQREDLSRYNGKDRYFRVLQGRDNEYAVGFPGQVMKDDVVWHFMLGFDQFNVFIDKEITLPTTLTVNYNNKSLNIRIVETRDY